MIYNSQDSRWYRNCLTTLKYLYFEQQMTFFGGSTHYPVFMKEFFSTLIA